MLIGHNGEVQRSPDPFIQLFQSSRSYIHKYIVTYHFSCKEVLSIKYSLLVTFLNNYFEEFIPKRNQRSRLVSRCPSQPQPFKVKYQLVKDLYQNPWSYVWKSLESPRGCTHQDYIRESPSEKMKKAPKVSNYFGCYPKVSSSVMERTQKYHRIVKRQSDSVKSQYAPQCTILQVISHLPN